MTELTNRKKALSLLEHEDITVAYAILDVADAIREQTKAQGGDVEVIDENCRRWIGKYERIHGELK